MDRKFRLHLVDTSMDIYSVVPKRFDTYQEAHDKACQILEYANSRSIDKVVISMELDEIVRADSTA